MNQTNLVELLQGVRFLQDLELHELADIAAISHLADLEAGDVIFREGETAEEIFLIVQGNVALEMCAPSIGCKRIMTAGDGELLGWSPILDRAQLTATARTLSPTKLVVINAIQLLAICDAQPRVGYDFMRRTALALARRLSATRLQLIDIYGSQMAHAGLPHVPPAQQGE